MSVELILGFFIYMNTVTATVYNAVPEQCDSDPSVTAFGYNIDLNDPIKHRYCAISRDLESWLQPGDTISIEGTDIYDGQWIVADRMNSRWTRKIDLLVNEDSYIDIFYNVTIDRCSENN